MKHEWDPLAFHRRTFWKEIGQIALSIAISALTIIVLWATIIAMLVFIANTAPTLQP